MNLVERLRDGQEIYEENWSLLDEAADCIEALEKQRDELQAQLTEARNALLREGMQRDELLADMVKAREEMACANFNSAAERIDHTISRVKEKV